MTEHFLTLFSLHLKGQLKHEAAQPNTLNLGTNLYLNSNLDTKDYLLTTFSTPMASHIFPDITFHYIQHPEAYCCWITFNVQDTFIQD